MTETEAATAGPIERLAQGEAAAVDDCLQQYGNLVWSLARRNSPSPEDAEDAVQEIFVDLWKSAHRFNAGRGSEVTFVCTIARRRLIDRRRYRHRRPIADSLEGPDGRIRDLPDPSAEQIENQAEAALVVKAMDELNPKERDVILLSIYQGMSHSQIAEHTGAPLGTVKTYIRRGLMRVAEILDRPRSARPGEAES